MTALSRLTDADLDAMSTDELLDTLSEVIAWQEATWPSRLTSGRYLRWHERRCRVEAALSRRVRRTCEDH